MKVVMGNFITASQAQSKWFTKVISKVSSGNYRLRVVRFFSLYLKVTGWLEGEKMQVYVRLGIRLLLKVRILIPPLLVTYQNFLQGAKDQTEGARGTLSINQGIKHDDPASESSSGGSNIVFLRRDLLTRCSPPW